MNSPRFIVLVLFSIQCISLSACRDEVRSVTDTSTAINQSVAVEPAGSSPEMTPQQAAVQATAQIENIKAELKSAPDYQTYKMGSEDLATLQSEGVLDGLSDEDRKTLESWTE